MSVLTDGARPDSPEFLRLAGHPLRWRLLGELARCDRTVRELCGLVGEPQNLVSYHLGKLRKAQLVASRRSSADGRDTYYRADLGRVAGQLTATGAALHPALRLVPGGRPTRDAEPAGDAGPAAGTGPLGAGPAPVLFLCSGNSARSQMAEALATERSGGLVEARSAGLRPKPLHPNAVRVMREVYGIDIAGRRAKHLDVFAGERFDEVVSLCDRLREACPELPGHAETVHWSMADPSEGHGDDLDAGYPVFRDAAADLDERIGYLVGALAGPPTAA